MHVTQHTAARVLTAAFLFASGAIGLAIGAAAQATPPRITIGATIEPKIQAEFLLNQKHSKGLRAVAAGPNGIIVNGGYIDMGDPSGNNWDPLIFAYNSDGELLWQWFFHDDGASDQISDIAALAEGTFLAAGNFGLYLDQTTGLGQLERGFIAKLNQAGEVIWQKTYGDGTRNFAIHGMTVLADGGALAVGRVSQENGDGNDVWILKIQASGKTDWQRTYDSGTDEYAVAVVARPAGGFSVLANRGNESQSEIWLIDINKAGKKLWDGKFGGEFNDYAGDLAVTADGGYVVAGWREDRETRGSQGFVLKIDSKHQTVWDRAIGGKDDIWLYGVAIQNTGDITVAGRHQPSEPIEKAPKSGRGEAPYLARINANGVLQWQFSPGGEQPGALYGIDTLASGALITSGEKSLDPPFTDAWTFRLK